ncbi:Hypothetical protein, putative [Bodo saltans]|uniref:Protein YIPF n=1 Tax=Bodo saltans TaxID=75058 RepID=A0A0S4JRK9_BODSA|nr:Hypothetical protein, putative [Bodo saltans]|eukprot:CUG94155.1 Hypothetical protein, putative [Bodo saltans]
MANPYASADMDPFAEDFRRAPPPQAMQPVDPAPPAPGAPQQFYSPSGHASQASQPYVPPQQQPIPLSQADAAAAAPPPIDPRARELQTGAFWKMEFYQQFFDIDTKQVLLRMANTLIPMNPPDFLMDRNWHGASGGNVLSTRDDKVFEEAGVVLNRNPDLYGPFWITTTLWMTLAVVSNIMDKIAYERNAQSVIDGTTAPSTGWAYNFTMASVACVTMYTYCFGMGAIIWGLMKWKSLPVTYLDAVCLYGYSMFIFLLVAILCMIPVTGLQWVFVLVGGAWSTLYLLINFWTVWKVALERSWFFFVVGLVVVMHMLLSMSFKFYFMNYSL